MAEFVESLQDVHLKSLLKCFMADPQIERGYRNAPAAKTLHHAYIGGLLDHVVSLFRLCDLACRNYPGVIDRDLLIAGAFLHDIGKLHELSFARTFAYTTRGQLLGHMIIELEMLQEKIAQVPGFPSEYKTLLEHMIISHHGKYEFGSPKMPMFPEALMLHYLDDLDSKMEAMRAHFEREPEMEWTSYNASLERPLLNTRKFLEKLRAGETVANAAVAAAASSSESEPQ
jgi:3'-5' exoribonuclease